MGTSFVMSEGTLCESRSSGKHRYLCSFSPKTASKKALKRPMFMTVVGKKPFLINVLHNNMVESQF